MQYIIDTNVIYYAAGVETNGSTKYALTNTDEWFFTDISICESVNRYMANEAKFNILKSFYQTNKYRLLKYLNSGFDIYDVFDLDFGSNEWSLLCNEIIKLKKSVESNGLKYANDLTVIVVAQTLVDKFNLKEREIQIFGSVKSYLVSNQIFVLGLINEKLEEFYSDEEESKFKTAIQSLILMSIWVALQGILASKYDMNLEEYRIELGKTSPIIPDDDPIALLIRKFTDRINDTTKRTRSWVEKDSHLFEALNLLDKSAALYPEISLGIQLYLKVFLEKIFINGKKIFKNDLLDSMLLREYPKYAIVTEDLSLKNIISELDPKFFSLGETYLASIKS